MVFPNCIKKNQKKKINFMGKLSHTCSCNVNDIILNEC